jgi:hypothetical protein
MPIGYALTFLTLRDTLACVQIGVMGVELTEYWQTTFCAPRRCCHHNPHPNHILMHDNTLPHEGTPMRSGLSPGACRSMVTP